MVFKKSICILLAAIAVVLITAHEHSDDPNDDQRREPNSNERQRRPPFGFPFTPFTGSGFPSFGFDGSRDRRPGPPPVDRPVHGPGNPNIYRQVVRCNYTTEPGNSCISCDQTMFCSRLNYGVVNTCRGHRPHCNNGQCSTTQIEECSY